MALHWNITDCKNMEALQVEETGEWAVTNALIWGTLAVDMGQITNKNIGEFYARVKVWELVSGALVQRLNQKEDTYADYFLSFGDIEKRIGLSTNVSNIHRTSAWFERIDRINADNRYKTPITKNKIKAVYYSALTEVEEYTLTTKEAVNA